MPANAFSAQATRSAFGVVVETACNMGRAVRHQPRKFADQSPLGLVLVSRTDSVGIVDVDPHDFEVCELGPVPHEQPTGHKPH